MSFSSSNSNGASNNNKKDDEVIGEIAMDDHEDAATIEPSIWIPRITYGHYTDVGYQHPYNEDTLVAFMSLFDSVPCEGVYRGSLSNNIAFFGVFDGHGGHTCSSWVRDNLHRHVAKRLWTRNYYSSCGPVLYNSFLSADQEFRKKYKSDSSGSCATCVLVKGHRVYCGNAGDSKALAISRNERGYPTIVELNSRHSAELKSERRRVLKAGGHISFDGRINGVLLPSRAIGDNDCKTDGKPVIIAAPDGKGLLSDPPHELDPSQITNLILATDGLWDFVPDDVVARIILDNERFTEREVALKLFHEARERQSEDDITIVLVRIALEPVVPCGTPASMSPAPQRAYKDNGAGGGGDDDDDDDDGDVVGDLNRNGKGNNAQVNNNNKGGDDDDDDDELQNTLVAPNALSSAALS